MSLNGPRPTLRDVARAAGVSHMTVCRVVNGAKSVAASTREAVRTAIDRLEYRPDPALSALAAYRVRTAEVRKDGSVLAFLDCDGTAYSKAVCAGVHAEALLHGYGVESHAFPADERQQQRLAGILFHRGVRGLCFGPSDEERIFKNWKWEAFAAVSLGALAHRPAFHAVAMDYFDGAFSACRALLAQGCRRVGFAVESRLETRTGHRWLGGYTAALDGATPYVFPSRRHRDEDVSGWLQRQRIDGLLTIHVEMLRDWWPRPEEHFCLLNDLTTPIPDGIARLSLAPRRIGAEGVRLLHHLLLRGEYGLPVEPRMVALRGTWKTA